MRSLPFFVRPLSVLAVAALVAACEPREPKPFVAPNFEPQESIEVAGVWDDDWAGPTMITSSHWGGLSIAKYDNDANFAIVKSPADDEDMPNKYSKLVWTEFADNSFWYCAIEYGQETAAAAEATTKVADASTPEDGGCGDFPWRLMTAAE